MKKLLGILCIVWQLISSSYAGESSGVVFTSPQRIAAYKIILQELFANVMIKNHDEEDILIQMDGDTELLKNVFVNPITKDGKTVLTMYHTRNKAISQPVNIIIVMPKETITKLNLIGDVALDVEAVHAPFGLKMVGNGKANIQTLKDKSDIELIGKNELLLDVIRGKLEIDIKGDGQATIRSGYIPYLNASVLGNGRVEISSDIFDGRTEVLGNGQVVLEGSVRGDIKKKKIGTGGIIYTQP